jgi:hypothetical protein
MVELDDWTPGFDQRTVEIRPVFAYDQGTLQT